MEKIPKEIAYKQEMDRKKGYDLGVKMGYKEGLVAGELQAMARIRKSINDYIDEQQRLYDNTDGEQGYNFDNCDVLETIINKIIMGEKL